MVETGFHDNCRHAGCDRARVLCRFLECVIDSQKYQHCPHAVDCQHTMQKHRSKRCGLGKALLCYDQQVCFCMHNRLEYDDWVCKKADRWTFHFRRRGPKDIRGCSSVFSNLIPFRRHAGVPTRANSSSRAVKEGQSVGDNMQLRDWTTTSSVVCL